MAIVTWVQNKFRSTTKPKRTYTSSREPAGPEEYVKDPVNILPSITLQNKI